MYFMSGGCTSLLHLMVEHPVLVLALGFAGFVSQVPANPGPGDRFGTHGMLSHTEREYVKANPQMTTRLAEIKVHFDTLEAQPSEDQVEELLHWSDPCTSAHPADILADNQLRKEAAWLLYLNVYGREGPVAARQFFASVSKSPPLPLVSSVRR